MNANLFYLPCFALVLLLLILFMRNNLCLFITWSSTHVLCQNFQAVQNQTILTLRLRHKSVSNYESNKSSVESLNLPFSCGQPMFIVINRLPIFFHSFKKTSGRQTCKLFHSLPLNYCKILVVVS